MEAEMLLSPYEVRDAALFPFRSANIADQRVLTSHSLSSSQSRTPEWVYLNVD